MRMMWRLVRYLPPGAMGFVRQQFGHNWTQWAVRQTVRSIPDSIVDMADGRRFRIGPDSIYLQIFAGRDFEPQETRLIRQLVQPGDVVLDVGANFGWYTTLCAQATGPTGHVYAFEPIPSTYARLRENLGYSGCHGNVTTVCSAVGEETGTVQMHLFDHLSHSRSSLSTLGERSFRRIAASMTDLDTFLEEHGSPRVRFLKCDVEGAEWMVLRGARKLLARPDAPIVLLELNDDTSKAFGFSKADLWKYLRQQGYDRFYSTGADIVAIDHSDQLDSVHLLLCGKGAVIQERMAAA